MVRNIKRQKSWKSLFIFWLPLSLALLIAVFSFKYRNKLHVLEDKFTIGYAYVLNGIWYPVQPLRNSLQFIVHLNRAFIHTPNAIQAETLYTLRTQVQRLQFENKQLRNQLQYKQAYSNDFYLARVIGVLHSPFLSQLILNIGALNNVQVNDAVLYKGFFIGRIINVNDKFSTVMLITDPNSRIPITIVETLENAIVKGNNSTTLMLSPYKGFQSDFPKGAHVVTSGISNLLPLGLPIGVIQTKDSERTYTVSPYVSLSTIQFVMVMASHPRTKKP